MWRRSPPSSPPPWLPATIIHLEAAPSDDEPRLVGHNHKTFIFFVGWFYSPFLKNYYILFFFWREYSILINNLPLRIIIWIILSNLEKTYVERKKINYIWCARIAFSVFQERKHNTQIDPKNKRPSFSFCFLFFTSFVWKNRHQPVFHFSLSLSLFP